MATPAHALSSPAIPVLTLDHTITSQPWGGAGGTAKDLEGSAYVPANNSLWISDDNRSRIYEINPDTGEKKSEIGAAALQAAARLDTVGTLTPVLSDASRTDDLESLAYDPNTDTLYLFSGNCCGVAPFNPTAYRLTRASSSDPFHVDSWQPMTEGQDATASAYRPGVGLYYGHGTKIKTYNYTANTFGSQITVSVGAPIVGMTFTDNGTLFVSTSDFVNNPAVGRVVRVAATGASTWSAVPGWTFDLRTAVPTNGPQDPRSVEIINDTFYVLDGADTYSSGDTNGHRVFVYNLGSAPAPTASFVAVPTIGRAPFTTQFYDTSTPVAPAIGAPTSWAWDFDGNNTVDSTQRFPTHRYATPGNFTAKLTATNAVGSTSATMTIKVKAATNLPGGYTLDGWGGLHRFKVGTGTLPPATSGAGYWSGWDIARGAAVLPTGTGGYTLDGWGGLHRFRIGGGANPPSVKGAPYWTGWDIARGVALLPNGKGGYEVDGYGGIHPFALGSNSAPPAVIGSKYWSGQDMARGISITPDGKGGFVTDRTGKLWPFKIGSGGTAPATPNGVAIITATSVQGVSIMFDGSGGYTVDGWGGAHPFGIGAFAPPPGTSGGPYWAGWDIARDIALMPDI